MYSLFLPFLLSLCLRLSLCLANTTPIFRDLNKCHPSDFYTTYLLQKPLRLQEATYQSLSSTKGKYWCYHSRLNQDKWPDAPREDKEEATLMSAQTHIVQKPSHAQEEVHLHSMEHHPSLYVTPAQRPWKPHSCLGNISVTQCQGNYMAQMIAQVGSWLLSNNSLVFNLLSALHQSRMKKCSALSFESIELWQFTGKLYLKQLTRGEGFGPNLCISIHHAAWWVTQLYKVSFTLSTGRYAIHMDGHESSLGHTCSACRREEQMNIWGAR